MSDLAGTAAFGRSREDAEFSQLYDRYYRPVRDFCRRRVAGDLVDDAVAETFLTAWRRRDDVPAGAEALGVVVRGRVPSDWPPVAKHGTSAPARGQIAVGGVPSPVGRGRVGDQRR